MLHHTVFGSKKELIYDSLICTGLICRAEAVLRTGKLGQYLCTLHEKLLFWGDFSEFKEFHGASLIPRPQNREFLEGQFQAPFFSVHSQGKYQSPSQWLPNASAVREGHRRLVALQPEVRKSKVSSSCARLSLLICPATNKTLELCGVTGMRKPNGARLLPILVSN